MKNIQQQQKSIRALAILAGSTLMLGAAAVQAQSGTITFAPFSAAKVPLLGSTMLILLAMLLAFIALVSLRKQQKGIAPVIAGALVLASLASAGGGVSLLHKAHAGTIGTVIVNPAGETFTLVDNGYNSYTNNSGVSLKVGPVTLPPPGDCPTDALDAPGACAIGMELVDGAQCEVDCGSIPD